jgi:hypothetical protein
VEYALITRIVDSSVQGVLPLQEVFIMEMAYVSSHSLEIGY